MTQHEIIVSGMAQDSHGEWFGESRMVPVSGAASAERKYAKANEQYEQDPDGDLLERKTLGSVATKHSGDLFFIPDTTHPEAERLYNPGIDVEPSDDDTSVPEAGFTGLSS